MPRFTEIDALKQYVDSVIVPNSNGTISTVQIHDILMRLCEITAAKADVNEDGALAFSQVPNYLSAPLSNIAALRKIIGGESFGYYCMVTGYFVAGDGGGGQFYWDAVSSELDDGGTVIKPTIVTGPGRWKRLSSGNDYNILWYGIKGTEVSDTQTLQATINSLPSAASLNIPQGTVLKINAPIVVNKAITLKGGGRLSFLNGITTSAAITIKGDESKIEGIIIENPNELYSPTGGKNVAILIQANNISITGNLIDRFQNGIVVDANGEWSNTIIIGNRVKDIIGGGEGTLRLKSDRGEDRGDGIVVWGCQATVIGNIVNCKEGCDARIGIHTEALTPYEKGREAAHPNAMVTISGNIVYGKFRRGIVTENVQHVTITGNSIADSTWWNICISRTQNVVVTGNTCLWTRTINDNQGKAWSPVRAPICVYGQSANINISVNVVCISGVADAAILLQSLSASDVVTKVSINNNNVYLNSGKCSMGIMGDNGGNDISISGNDISGFDNIGIYFYGGQEIFISQNIIKGINAKEGIHVEGAQKLMIDCNVISNAGRGVSATNISGYTRVCNNLVADVKTGIDGWGSKNVTCTGNSFINAIENKITNINATVNGNLVVSNN